MGNTLEDMWGLEENAAAPCKSFAPIEKTSDTVDETTARNIRPYERSFSEESNAQARARTRADAEGDERELLQKEVTPQPTVTAVGEEMLVVGI
ncbi:hypothetical protein MUK42_34034 [Musa troglodytarum]|uniref:Uncharacterized protein n=1 Tax=Musa troglodytarum TaxID=320322 RepID=A0A9E7JU70_9LILI|nr:hypothetical protein MUK42_34034 [Musa troglodytarum]